jgi:hypothetical protein
VRWRRTRTAAVSLRACRDSTFCAAPARLRWARSVCRRRRVPSVLRVLHARFFLRCTKSTIPYVKYSHSSKLSSPAAPLTPLAERLLRRHPLPQRRHPPPAPTPPAPPCTQRARPGNLFLCPSPPSCASTAAVAVRIRPASALPPWAPPLRRGASGAPPHDVPARRPGGCGPKAGSPPLEAGLGAALCRSVVLRSASSVATPRHSALVLELARAGPRSRPHTKHKHNVVFTPAAARPLHPSNQTRFFAKLPAPPRAEH